MLDGSREEPRGNESLAEVSLATHPGAVRKDNQDRVGRAACPTAQLVVVADGVGGEAGGARAAELAVAAYVALLASCRDATRAHSAAEALQRATGMVQQQIQHVRATEPAFSAMASTVAVVCLQAGLATVGHLGDARVYLLHAGELRRLTQDHSLVQQMVQRGVLTDEEALHHPQGHILTQSLGQPGAMLEVTTQPVEEQDVLLLCSDGLWSCVAEETLSMELGAAGPDLSQVSQRLLDLALEAGAPDNVSLALLRVRPEPSPARKPSAAATAARAVSASHRASYVVAALLLVALTCMVAWFSYHRTVFP